MSEDSGFMRDQEMEEECSAALDFYGSLGKGMLAKEKLETLRNSSGLTPLGYGINNRSMDRCSAGLSPLRMQIPIIPNFTYEGE